LKYPDIGNVDILSLLEQSSAICKLLVRLVADTDAAKGGAGRSPFDGVGLLNLVNLVCAEFRTIDQCGNLVHRGLMLVIEVRT